MTRLEVVTAACFVLGTGLLLPFESTFTILAGVLLLVAFVVCGLFVLLTAEALGRDPD